MRLVDGVKTVGFRKWYQRELTRSHLSLVAVLLCAIGAMVTVELIARPAPLSDRLGSLVLLIVCSAIGAVALRRYVALLMRAEQAARDAVCPGCAAYARFDLVDHGAQRTHMEVRCRTCRHVWSMSDAGDE